MLLSLNLASITLAFGLIAQPKESRCWFYELSGLEILELANVKKPRCETTHTHTPHVELLRPYAWSWRGWAGSPQTACWSRGGGGTAWASHKTQTSRWFPWRPAVSGSGWGGAWWSPPGGGRWRQRYLDIFRYFDFKIRFLESTYLLHAAEGVHVVEDGDHLAVCLLGVQDVAADTQVFHHQLHQEGA